MFERRENCHNNASRSIPSNTRNGWAPAKARAVLAAGHLGTPAHRSEC